MQHDVDLLVFDIVVLQHHIDELCLDIVVRVNGSMAEPDISVAEGAGGPWRGGSR